MKTIRMSVLLASMVGAATLFLAVPASMSATPGEGWDVFIYTGEPITTEAGSYMGTALGSEPGYGFNLFNSGEGEKIEDFAQAYMGTSMGSEASGGWDLFNAGEREGGDPLP
jgi:hypothetical protein